MFLEEAMDDIGDAIVQAYEIDDHEHLIDINIIGRLDAIDDQDQNFNFELFPILYRTIFL